MQEFDLYRFLTKNIKENTDLFCRIVQKEFKDPAILSVLVLKTLKAVERLREYDLPEELMLFLPYFFE